MMKEEKVQVKQMKWKAKMKKMKYIPNSSEKKKDKEVYGHEI